MTQQLPHPEIRLQRGLRGVLLLEIVLVFALYLVVFLALNFMLYRQNQLASLVQVRTEQREGIQKLERLLLEQVAVPLVAPESYKEVLTARHASFHSQLKALQVQLDSVSVTESADTKQEQLLAERIHAEYEELAVLLAALTQTPITEYATAQLSVNQPEQASRFMTLQGALRSDIESWQRVVRNDVIRLNQSERYLRRVSIAILGVQAILVILSLFVIGYTYVSPSFERLLKQVMRQNKQLKDVDRVKSEFLSIASHQLRTPLSELKWTLTLLGRESTPKLSAKQRAYIEQAKTSTATMIKLVTNLLNISRIEQNRLEFEPAPTNIVALIKSVCTDAAEAAKKQSVTVHTDFAQETITLTVDPLLMRQVLQNLVHNAILYNQTGGSVWVKVNPAHHGWLIQVVDTGRGIAKEDMNKLFTKFFRASDALKMYPDGSGLGLYFVKRIVQKHNGKIWVKSKLGSGTSFSIHLPNHV